jgi:hypothetical protein
MSSAAQKRAIQNYRLRLKKRGAARFEVLGLKADRDLIRSLAKTTNATSRISTSSIPFVALAVRGTEYLGPWPLAFGFWLEVLALQAAPVLRLVIGNLTSKAEASVPGQVSLPVTCI